MYNRSILQILSLFFMFAMCTVAAEPSNDAPPRRNGTTARRETRTESLARLQREYNQRTEALNNLIALRDQLEREGGSAGDLSKNRYGNDIREMYSFEVQERKNLDALYRKIEHLGH